MLAHTATSANASDSHAPCVFADSSLSAALPATNTKCHANPNTTSPSRYAQYGTRPPPPTSSAAVTGTNAFEKTAQATNKPHPTCATTSGPALLTKSPVPSAPGANIARRCARIASAVSSKPCPPSFAPIIASGAADITRNIRGHAIATHAVPLRAFAEALLNVSKREILSSRESSASATRREEASARPALRVAAAQTPKDA